MKRSALLLLTLASFASAHPGHATGFAAGSLHPMTGWDHWAAMLAVGIWAVGQKSSKAVWALPASFAGALMAGIFAPSLVSATMAEIWIAVSLLVMGAALLSRFAPSLAKASALVAVLGFGHGVAHGTEMQGSVLTFAVGAGLTTFALHLSGSAVGRWMMQRRWEIAMGGGLLGGGLFQLARLFA